MINHLMPERFSKWYETADAGKAAVANHHWLAGLGTALRLPRLLGVGERHVDFEHVHGRHAAPADLVMLAAHLGDVHGSAFVVELHRARLDRPHETGTGHRLPDFLARRVDAVQRRLRTGSVPDPMLNTDEAVRLLREAAPGPAAFYKDANPRNVILTGQGPVTIDVDEVTLAPFGYDFAKLVVTVAMTHGTLPAATIAAALAAYNRTVNGHQPGLGNVTWIELMTWAEIHHILTSHYLGRGGYQHSWHRLRPLHPRHQPTGRSRHESHRGAWWR
jgi:hypothetical protein